MADGGDGTVPAAAQGGGGSLASLLGSSAQQINPIIQALLGNSNFTTGTDLATNAANANAGNLSKQQQLEQELMSLATAPVQDAMGNATGYDPTTGTFKTSLSNTGRAIEGGANQNTINMLDALAPMWNTNYQANAQSRNADTLAGQGFLGQLTGPTPYSAAGMTGDIQRSALQGVNNAYRNITNPVVMQMMRSGSDMSNLGNMLEPLAQQESADYSKAMSDAAISGPQTAESLNSNWNSRIGGDFNTTNSAGANYGASPASGISNLDSSLTNLITNRGSGITQAGAAGGSASNGAAYANASGAGIGANANQKVNPNLQSAGSDVGSALSGVGNIVNGLGNIASLF